MLSNNNNREKLNNPEGKDVSVVLKNIRQSLLKQAYDTSLNSRIFVSPRSQKSESQTLMKSNSTHNTRKSLDRLQYQSNQSRIQSKYNEPSIFSGSLNEKSIEKKNTDRIKLMQQKDIINSLQRHQSLQIQKQRKKRDDYKTQLQNQMLKRQEEKHLNKQHEIELYRNKLPRNNSLNNKNNSFIQYYRNAEAYHVSNAEHYIKYFTDIKLKQEERRRREKDQSQRQFLAMKIQMLQQARHKSLKRDELRQTLLLQMQQKKNKNRWQMGNKNSGYVKYENNEHNTIYNPIDYGMDMRNKYVVNEIVKHSPKLGHIQ